MSYSFIPNTPNYITLRLGAMVQAPYAPPLIPEATNRKTDRTAVEVPAAVTVVVVQGTAQSIGTGKRRRPTETVGANVVEDPVEVPKAAWPCRETRRIGCSRIRLSPTPGCRLGRRALQNPTCCGALGTEYSSIRIRVQMLYQSIPLPIRGYMPTRRT